MANSTRRSAGSSPSSGRKAASGALSRASLPQETSEAPGQAVHEQLSDIHAELCSAIAVIKTVNAALDEEFDTDLCERTLRVAVDCLDSVYNELDLALLRLAREGASPTGATVSAVEKAAGPAIPPVSESRQETFSVLLRRMMVTVNQLKLASTDFGDLTSVPEEHVSAALVVQEATADLDQLYDDFDKWEISHKPDSKPSGRPLGVFKDDRAERTPLAGLPPATDCPFCGRHDDIMVSQIQPHDHEQGPWFRAHCGTCGVDAPGGSTVLEATQGWNRRPGQGAVQTDAQPSHGKALPSTAYSDKTADRIIAFLSSVRPLRGFSVEDEFERGRALIERIAMSARDTDNPTVVLSVQHVADVLGFLAFVEPFEPCTWWQDPPNSPSHVAGFELLLRALESSLRNAAPEEAS